MRRAAARGGGSGLLLHAMPFGSSAPAGNRPVQTKTPRHCWRGPESCEGLSKPSRGVFAYLLEGFFNQELGRRGSGILQLITNGIAPPKMKLLHSR